VLWDLLLLKSLSILSLTTGNSDSLVINLIFWCGLLAHAVVAFIEDFSVLPSWNGRCALYGRIGARTVLLHSLALPANVVLPWYI